MIDERFMDIPAGTDLCISNKLFKVLLFLEADHVLLMEGQAPFLIRSGDLLVQPLALRQVYRANRKNAASRIHVFRLLLDLPLPRMGKARREAFTADGTNLRGFLARHLNGIHHLPAFITPQVQKQLAQLRNEAEERRPGYRFEASHLAFSVMIEAIRQIHPAQPTMTETAPGKSLVAIIRTKEYLVENLALPLTLDQIAWHVRLSREHLARLFRQVAGQTVFDYLAELRLEAARTHLCNPNLLVVEVARRSGYSSLPLFCRTFKRAMKITPLEYRMRRMGEVRFSPSKYSKTTSHGNMIKSDLF